MVNKRKRLERKIRNRNNDKQTKELGLEKGKLIKDNHNNEYYSKEFTIERSNKLIKLIQNFSKENFINEFRKYKDSIINLVLYWNPNVDNTNKLYLVNLLNNYWDDKQQLL